MKKNHIIDKLFNIAIIMIILFSTILFYNSVIDYFLKEDKYYYEFDEEYKELCISDAKKFNEEDCLTQYNKDKQDFIDHESKNEKSTIITTLGMMIISTLFLILVNKKDFLKNELGLKILNAILLLISLAGLLALYSYIVEAIFYDYKDVLLTSFQIFGFVLFPLIFYYLINKYFFKTKEKH